MSSLLVVAGPAPRGWEGVAQLYDDSVLTAPDDTDTWLGLTDAALPVGAAADWAVRPDCGALVLFSGTARDHAPGREGVEQLEYEAYEEHVVPRLAEIAEKMRTNWPTLGRIVLLHRIGEVPVGESSVVVVASSPHRPESFEAARFGIDTLKATVPIWKREVWARRGERGVSTLAKSTMSALSTAAGNREHPTS